MFYILCLIVLRISYMHAMIFNQIHSPFFSFQFFLYHSITFYSQFNESQHYMVSVDLKN